MDLSKFAQNDSCKVELVNPISGEGLGAFVTIYSKDSKQFRKAQLEIAKGSIDDGGVYMLAHLTKEWDGIEYEGSELECTPENAALIYSEVPPFYDQLERVVFDRVKFMKVTPKSS